MLPGLILLGAAGGAAWAFIPAVLKTFVGVNEIISTLMLNYIALLWVDYMVFGSWADPTAFSFPYSRPFPPQAHFPVLLGDIHIGLVLALIAALLLAGLLQRTHWGYEIRTIGASLPAARYAGMRVRRNVLLVMAASGALAGLAGVGEVSGVIHRIQQGISPGYGFTAIIVAWVARLNPWAVILVAVLFAALLNGGFVIQTAGVPAAIAYMIQASVLFLVLASEHLLRRVRRRRALSQTRAASRPDDEPGPDRRAPRRDRGDGDAPDLRRDRRASGGAQRRPQPGCGGYDARRRRVRVCGCGGHGQPLAGRARRHGGRGRPGGGTCVIDRHAGNRASDHGPLAGALRHRLERLFGKALHRHS